MNEELMTNGVVPLTVGNTWPGWPGWPGFPIDSWASPFYVSWPWYITPNDCTGDIHVFPCPTCGTCKCGAATMRRATKK